MDPVATLFNSMGWTQSTTTSNSSLNANGGQKVTAPKAPGFSIGDLAKETGNVIGGVTRAVAAPVVNAAHTGASLLGEGALGAYRTGAATVDALHGDTAGAKRQIIQTGQDQKDSYIGHVYGSDSKGDTHGLTNAANFGLTAATLAAPLIAPAAEAAEGATVASKAVTAVKNAPKNLIGAGETLGSNPVTALAGKAVRNVIQVQPTAQFAGQTAQDVAQERCSSCWRGRCS